MIEDLDTISSTDHAIQLAPPTPGQCSRASHRLGCHDGLMHRDCRNRRAMISLKSACAESLRTFLHSNAQTQSGLLPRSRLCAACPNCPSPLLQGLSGRHCHAHDTLHSLNDLQPDTDARHQTVLKGPFTMRPCLAAVLLWYPQ